MLFCRGAQSGDRTGLADHSAQILASLAEVRQDQAFCADLPRRAGCLGSGHVVVSQRQAGMGKCCKAGIGLTRPRYGALGCKPRPPLIKWRYFEPSIITCAVGWYLRFSLSDHDVEELFTERGIPADPPPSGVGSSATRPNWTIDAAGNLSPPTAPGHPCPKVINVDGNPSYPKVVAELKTEGKLGRRCRCRACPYLNSIVEQDHRVIKSRVNASQGFRSFHRARRTIQGYEVVDIIRKGQVRWLSKGDVVGLVQFIHETLRLWA